MICQNEADETYIVSDVFGDVFLILDFYHTGQRIWLFHRDLDLMLNRSN